MAKQGPKQNPKGKTPVITPEMDKRATGVTARVNEAVRMGAREMHKKTVDLSRGQSL